LYYEEAAHACNSLLATLTKSLGMNLTPVHASAAHFVICSPALQHRPPPVAGCHDMMSTSAHQTVQLGGLAQLNCLGEASKDCEESASSRTPPGGSQNSECCRKSTPSTAACSQSRGAKRCWPQSICSAVAILTQKTQRESS
jgi:hypothetical protein